MFCGTHLEMLCESKGTMKTTIEMLVAAVLVLYLVPIERRFRYVVAFGTGVILCDLVHRLCGWVLADMADAERAKHYIWYLGSGVLMIVLDREHLRSTASIRTSLEEEVAGVHDAASARRAIDRIMKERR